MWCAEAGGLVQSQVVQEQKAELVYFAQEGKPVRIFVSRVP